MDSRAAPDLVLIPPPRCDGRTLWVGFSGGMDSTVLLHRLVHRAAELANASVRAVHVHHGLQPAADAWSAHCVALCDAWGVPCTVLRVQVMPAGEGLEAAARSARYAAFRGLLAPGDVLALAHHRDDQAETFLLRALRGAGVDGLAGMRAERDLDGLQVWRPLLAHARDALADYANAHALRWIEDPSNADPGPDRNWLRQVLMPQLRERWPHAASALARSAQLCGDASTLLGMQDAQALDACRAQAPATLAVEALLRLEAPRRARVLRRWIEALRLPPLPSQGVASVEHALLRARADSQASFAWHGARVEVWRGLLHASRACPPLPTDLNLYWDGRRPLVLPLGGALTLHGAEAFPTPLHVHARRGGERIRLPGRTHSHALKHVLQDAGVAPWLRRHLPLLSDSEGVVAAADRVYDARFAQWLCAHGARVQWTAPPAH